MHCAVCGRHDRIEPDTTPVGWVVDGLVVLCPDCAVIVAAYKEASALPLYLRETIENFMTETTNVPSSASDREVIANLTATILRHYDVKKKDA